MRDHLQVLAASAAWATAIVSTGCERERERHDGRPAVPGSIARAEASTPDAAILADPLTTGNDMAHPDEGVEARYTQADAGWAEGLELGGTCAGRVGAQERRAAAQLTERCWIGLGMKGWMNITLTVDADGKGQVTRLEYQDERLRLIDGCIGSALFRALRFAPGKSPCILTVRLHSPAQSTPIK